MINRVGLLVVIYGEYSPTIFFIFCLAYYYILLFAFFVNIMSLVLLASSLVFFVYNIN